MSTQDVVRLKIEELDALRAELELMERQAIRRMENETLTPEEVEAVGLALLRLEETIGGMARQFGLDPDDLNLDLGPLGRLI